MPQMQKDARVCWASFFRFSAAFSQLHSLILSYSKRRGARACHCARKFFFYFVWIREGLCLGVWKKYNRRFRFAQDALKPYCG